jgi:hypothetical protein
MEEWFDLMDPDISQLFQSQGVAVNLEQLVDRLLDLIHDPARRAEMGRAGRAKVERTYRWARVIPRYQDAWVRLRAEAGGGTPGAEAPLNPYCLGPGRLFTGYASNLLEPGTLVQSADGVLDESPYNETAALLGPALCGRVLQFAGQPIRLDELVQATGGVASRAWFAVQWLLKYGFLRLVQPARRDNA